MKKQYQEVSQEAYDIALATYKKQKEEEEKQDNLFEFEKLVCNMSHEELTKALEIILNEIRLSETAIKEGYEK